MKYLVTYADPNGAGTTREATIEADRFELDANRREASFYTGDELAASVTNYYAVVPAPQDAPAGD